MAIHGYLILKTKEDHKQHPMNQPKRLENGMIQKLYRSILAPGAMLNLTRKEGSRIML